ncbi:MAG TPA: ATP-binding protein [Vicinamibacterales bacterium]|nr:ATP-binding protein [Vicinamibacterales bacterium]
MAKRPAKAARQDDVFFRHMVGNMRNGVLAIDRQGAIVIINDEAKRLFQLAPDDVIGEPYPDVLHQHPDIVRVLGGAFELKSLPNRAELRLKSTDTVIGYTLSLIRDGNGDAVGASLLFKDLTHVEQMEERERLRDRLAAVGEMAAVMAHEIKNPLAGIEVLAGLLRRKAPGNPEVQSLVGDIINEAKMANAIVQEVLAFVRPVRLQVDRTSLSDAVLSAVGLADNKATRGNIILDVAIPKDLPTLGADQHQLTQVFCNLLINAYEALEGRGRIEIAARVVRTVDDGALLPDGHMPVPTVVVDIVDDGPGMPPDVADKIFNPFFTTKAQGSGLGLAIVRKIIDAHDGRIDMTTADGRGTRFRVTLPVEPTKPKQDFTRKSGVKNLNVEGRVD